MQMTFFSNLQHNHSSSGLGVAVAATAAQGVDDRYVAGSGAVPPAFVTETYLSDMAVHFPVYALALRVIEQVCIRDLVLVT